MDMRIFAGSQATCQTHTRVLFNVKSGRWIAKGPLTDTASPMSSPGLAPTVASFASSPVPAAPSAWPGHQISARESGPDESLTPRTSFGCVQSSHIDIEQNKKREYRFVPLYMREPNRECTRRRVILRTCRNGEHALNNLCPLSFQSVASDSCNHGTRNVAMMS